MTDWSVREIKVIVVIVRFAGSKACMGLFACETD